MNPTREAVPCAVCSEARARPLLIARDSDGLEAEPFSVVACEGCGTAYVSPRPPASDLGRFYIAGYYDKPGEDSGGAGRRLGRLFMLERVAKAEAGGAPGRVLDIGCGEGTFLAAMNRKGWEAWGVEISKDGAARAAARPGLKVFSEPLDRCPLPAKGFDRVTLWHSIEHVTDPGGLLKTAAGLLKDDGRMLVAFPSSASWDFRLFGARWFHLDPPRHLHYFTPQSMARLLSAAGLRAVRVRHLSWEYNPFGFVQSVLNLVTPRFNFLYRRLKGTLPPEQRGSAADVAATFLLLFPLTVLSVPYTLFAALAGASGCVEVEAIKEGPHGRR